MTVIRSGALITGTRLILVAVASVVSMAMMIRGQTMDMLRERSNENRYRLETVEQRSMKTDVKVEDMFARVPLIKLAMKTNQEEQRDIKRSLEEVNARLNWLFGLLAVIRWGPARLPSQET